MHAPPQHSQPTDATRGRRLASSPHTNQMLPTPQRSGEMLKGIQADWTFASIAVSTPLVGLSGCPVGSMGAMGAWSAVRPVVVLNPRINTFWRAKISTDGPTKASRLIPPPGPRWKAGFESADHVLSASPGTRAASRHPIRRAPLTPRR